MIKIGNVYKPTVGFTHIYVGRPKAGTQSPLGNPFPITATQTRDMVCDKYHLWLQEKLKDPNSPQSKEIQRLKNIKGNIELLCFCTPKRCHAESIKEAILC